MCFLRVLFSWIASQRINIYLDAKLIKSDNKFRIRAIPSRVSQIRDFTRGAMFESSLFSTKFSSNNNVAKPRLAIGSNYNFPNLAGLSRYLANSRDRCNPGELQLTYRDNRRVPLSSLAIEKGIRCKISRIKKKWSNRKLNRILILSNSIFQLCAIIFRATTVLFNIPDFENALWKEIRKDG